MGSVCGCPSPSLPITPRPTVPYTKRSHLLQHTQRKFQDIRPVEKENLDQSLIGLLHLNNHLSGRIHEFQSCNGPISGRSNKVSWGGESTIRHKIGFTSRFGNRQQLHSVLCSQNKNSQRPISNDNIKLNFGESMISQTEKSQTREEGRSCLLSQKSHVLAESIFSDRMIEKAQFYGRHNRLGGIELYQWKTQQRLSYHIKENELSELLNSYSENIPKLLIQSIFNYYENHLINLLSYCRNPSGIKIYFNGIKRLLPIIQGCREQPQLMSIVYALRPLLQGSQISTMAYYLTGWFPEELKISEITSFSGIFERLSTNMDDGNTLVFFSRNQGYQRQYVLLTKVDLKTGTLTYNTCNCSSTVPEMFYENQSNYDYTMKIENFVEFFDLIHLNWNPTIYEYTLDREFQFTEKEKMNKFSLVIPPSSQDIEIRLFIQKHQSLNGQDTKSKLLIKLFEYENVDLQDDSTAVRIIQANENIFSDVLIFESCKQKTQYMLTIQDKSGNNYEHFCYTITLLSFVEMYFDRVKDSIFLKQITQEAEISLNNLGFGINSPYFDKNLQYLVECESKHQLVVTIDAPDNLLYEICLIPNAEGHEVMTKLKLQTIINHSSISGLKMGAGAMSIKTTQSKYLLVINSFSEFTGKFNITLSLNGKIFIAQPTLTIKALGYDQQVAYQKQIKWLPTYSGPRKRLKSNCNNRYQSSQHFTEYFKNPVIDKQLSKGRYQFFVKSQTFRECFDAIDLFQDKNMCDPPALSMSIFAVSEDQQQYKILLDDAFYVPFGVGFWTQQIDLEQGNYRFVCPKMDKTFSVGTFGVVKC